MELVGEGIPYTQFNFRTLEDFLTSMPDVCQICWSGRDLMVMGVADSATQHIEKMVARQQNSKKGGKGGRFKQAYFPPRFGGGGAVAVGSARNLPVLLQLQETAVDLALNQDQTSAGLDQSQSWSLKPVLLLSFSLLLSF